MLLVSVGCSGKKLRNTNNPSLVKLGLLAGMEVSHIKMAHAGKSFGLVCMLDGVVMKTSAARRAILKRMTEDGIVLVNHAGYQLDINKEIRLVR
jgi:hypothetical protein